MDQEKTPRPGERPAFAFRIRVGSVFLRAAHLLAASVVAGACVLRVDDPRLSTWWALAGVSGTLLLAVELVRHPGLMRELAGWATVVKLALLGVILAAPGGAPWLMSAAFVVAVLGAHFPRGWRHRRLF